MERYWSRRWWRKVLTAAEYEGGPTGTQTHPGFQQQIWGTMSLSPGWNSTPQPLLPPGGYSRRPRSQPCCTADRRPRMGRASTSHRHNGFDNALPRPRDPSALSRTPALSQTECTPDTDKGRCKERWK
ncbi:hypothetical protein DPEC_G00241790 [Dallia pectoralis]|uniref:Uncharacterized protein n=1 Tax=Dallia pectoralis TaxID=75939 RepID=A0ACC2FUX3_DALPE|nr:hypothetical protein DPEC_G00241790 [Dallia pectoralis]